MSQQIDSVESSPLVIEPEKANAELLQLEVDKIRAEKLVSAVLEAIPGPAMVLNEQRQIVTANQRLLDFVGAKTLDQVLGTRPGEILHCKHAAHAQHGCSTSPSCSFCGAIQAITQSQITKKTQTREYRIPLDNPHLGGIDAEVVASPAIIDGTQFTIVAMRDISSEKRRRVLERVFFHDVLNTAGGLRALVSLLQHEPENINDGEFVGLLDDLCERLVEVISQQRQLLAAESGELTTHPMFVSVPSLLSSIQKLYEHHDLAESRQLNLGDIPDVDVVTDMNLARRVLENMVKNALEASPPDAIITLEGEDLGEEVALRVHNPGVIPKDAQHQIFQRSFSTKGKDRGLGTYSMRLLGEGYLGGEVGFTSSKERGTTFVFMIPKRWKGKGSNEGW